MLTCLVLGGIMGVSLATGTQAYAQDEVAVETVVADDVVADEVAAEEGAADETDLGVGYALDNVMLFFCAVLVLFMQAGFAMVEVGLNSAKNTVNILSKNVMDLAVGALLFFFVGFGLMYPGSYGEVSNAYFSFGGTGIYEDASLERTFSPQVDWLFQAVFAATAATIVSGAVAGRMKFSAYMVYSALLTGLIYPISGYWKWGGGWLMQFGELVDGEYTMAFQDFAGSAVVHAVGGFAGLAGAMILGPRLGRFTADGKSVPLPGHNIAFAALGVFILWVGWYGFNPGSQLAFQGTGDIDATVFIAVNTTLAAAAGAVVATMLSWVMFSKPDLTMSLNGALGGLVGITACCDAFTNGWSMVVGGVAGGLVVLGVIILDKAKIDDPVGAWPVHGLCGVWGCMSLGILPNTHLESGATSFAIQLIGTASICAWAFVTMGAVFLALKAMGMLRVSAVEEQAGLDISEHGMHAYPSDAIAGGSIT
ncbi:Ammonium transporter NrgA [Rubripirellula lacrimiformis]|uniref:Ammonium transporter n=1 Tax=Rubripirellula lacrimiformis TaxID=1930273 RepID=A0A517N780_9BACT|nr:ammonium transporter [Rubripirellula lacrimiformis]QDT03009.1 Ammonium transporter NrgA [Rubripirellula lacrimiformis]